MAHESESDKANGVERAREDGRKGEVQRKKGREREIERERERERAGN